jgi:hypothetical protein
VEESTLRRVTAVLGWKPTQAHPVRGGGYTPAERWIVSAGEGLSAFVKIGVTPFTAEALRAEARSYRLLQGDFLPALIGFDDRDERPLLVLESLDHGYWPPPWRPGDVERVLEMLARVAAVRPSSADLPSLEDMRAEFSSWTEVERDPIPFLSLGLCSRGWLARALPTLLRAEAAAVLDGDDLVHGDVRSDNLCLLPDRALLVDWNFACRGNARLDRAAAAPSIAAEGGPSPDELLPGEPELVSAIAGFFAARAGLPRIADAPRVRWVQQRQLVQALPWATRVLGLPPLDGSGA